MDYQPYVNLLIKTLLTMDSATARKVIGEALQYGDALTITSELIVPALENIGRGWESGNVALSQVYMAGRISEELIDEILPPNSPKRTDQPPIGIAVLNDHHILGKRVISSALRASGFEITDLGQGLSSEELIALCEAKSIHFLLISVLMLPSALHVKEICAALKPKGVKIMVGGAPFRLDKTLWQEVGADATGDNAGAAVIQMNKLMEEYYAGL
jgi:methanogenic corrinoid protein MtbC1